VRVPDRHYQGYDRHRSLSVRAGSDHGGGKPANTCRQRDRAACYDAENAVVAENFAELVEAADPRTAAPGLLGVAEVDWLLGDIAAGQIFAAGHGERGNDVGLNDAQVRPN
jgi:hypothetical protein